MIVKIEIWCMNYHHSAGKSIFKILFGTFCLLNLLSQGRATIQCVYHSPLGFVVREALRLTGYG